MMAHAAIELNSGWTAINASKITDPGTTISQPSYPLDGWLAARVPGTVLTTLIENGVYRDPYFGLNSQQIPDISKAGVPFYTYWFAATVDVPAIDAGQQVWLHFRGINYTAEVFFNGQQLTASPVSGMFLRHAFNITPWVNAGGTENRVAVLVTPPDPAGTPGGNGGVDSSDNIALNVTQRYTIGWDWVLPIPDRNTGIWDRVGLEVTGAVTIANPHVVTTIGDGSASVTITAELSNASPEAQTCDVSCSIDGQTVSTTITLDADASAQIVTIGTITIDQPRLWWPNGYGAQPLYEVALAVTIGGVVSDTASLQAGLRELGVNTLKMKSGTTSRQFLVNGQPIYLRGGNWIGSDAMLRLSRKRYDDEVRMLAMSNLNFLRVWGGGIAERPEFYEACDRHGMLVMQDFWMSSEYTLGYPDTYPPFFLACAEDTIKLLRNHASLLFWCGGNESTPPDPIPAQLQQWIEGTSGPVLDGTRIYVTESTDIAGSNQTIDGPYGILEPPDFYGGPGNGILMDTPFNPELGSVGTPVQASVLRMMPANDANDFPTVKPFNDDWTLHCYIGYQASDGVNQVTLYGTPSTLEQFTFYAQLANYIQYRALIEGYTEQMWTEATGFAIWKVQNPWPGLRGSLYDWYLDPNAALYGARCAAEPVHVQLDLSTYEVMVVNTSPSTLSALAWNASIIDVDGNTTSAGSGTVASAPPMSVTSTGAKVTMPSGLDVWFVHLTLSGDGVDSANLYWLYPSGGDYTGLAALPATQIDVQGSAIVDPDRYRIEVTAKNTAASIAFFLRLQVREADGVTRILPAFYSDNFFSLLASAQRTITIDFARSDVKQQGDPQVWIEGWGLGSMQVPVAFARWEASGAVGRI